MNIPDDDRGLLLGDGLFETILSRQGALVLLDVHIARMRSGAEVMGLPSPDKLTLVNTARRAALDGRLQGQRAAVRLTLTAGSGGRGLDRPDPPQPRLFATAAPSPRPTSPVRLALSQVRRNDGSPASRLKTLAYVDNLMARRQARDAGAEEAVMLNSRGELCCASAANLFWIERGRLFTPALDCGVLAGVMRSEVLGRAAGLGLPAVEVRAGPQALEGSDAVFVTNSLVGVRPAAGWQGRAFGPHPAVEALSAAVAEIS